MHGHCHQQKLREPVSRMQNINIETHGSGFRFGKDLGDTSPSMKMLGKALNSIKQIYTECPVESDSSIKYTVTLLCNINMHWFQTHMHWF